MTREFDSFEGNTRLLNLSAHTGRHTSSEETEEEHGNSQENIIFHTNYVLLKLNLALPKTIIFSFLALNSFVFPNFALFLTAVLLHNIAERYILYSLGRNMYVKNSLLGISPSSEY
jgi:uncharacterized membrane protein